MSEASKLSNCPYPLDKRPRYHKYTILTKDGIWVCRCGAISPDSLEKAIRLGVGNIVREERGLSPLEL